MTVTEEMIEAAIDELDDEDLQNLDWWQSILPRIYLAMRSKDHSIVGDDVRERVCAIITFNRNKSSLEIADKVLTAIGSQSIEGERAGG